MKKYTFEEIMEQRPDQVTVSKKNLEEILREGIDNVVNGGLPMDLEVARTNDDDHLISVWWSYGSDDCHQYRTDFLIGVYPEGPGEYNSDWPEKKEERFFLNLAIRKMIQHQREIKSKIMYFLEEENAFTAKAQAEELSHLLHSFSWYADYYMKHGGTSVHPVEYSEKTIKRRRNNWADITGGTPVSGGDD